MLLILSRIADRNTTVKATTDTVNANDPQRHVDLRNNNKLGYRDVCRGREHPPMHPSVLLAHALTRLRISMLLLPAARLAHQVIKLYTLITVAHHPFKSKIISLTILIH